MEVKKLRSCEQFDWDQWNTDKIRQKHKVEPYECEEVFFDDDKVILKDVLHSEQEKRFVLLGKTKKKRLLFLVYTERNHKIRVISARDLNKRERGLYGKTDKDS